MHLLFGRAGSIPALVTDGTTMVVMQGAHDVVILYLIVDAIMDAIIEINNFFIDAKIRKSDENRTTRRLIL